MKALAAALALIAGLAALVGTAPRSDPTTLSWESLLSPYSSGAPLPEGYRVASIDRGAGGDVVIAVSRPGEAPTIEVHIVRRGQWTGIRESSSFGIAYETPRSPAAEREAVTEAIANAVRAQDRGLPPPEAIPLRPADADAMPWWLEVIRGGRGVLIGASLLVLGVLALTTASTAVLVFPAGRRRRVEAADRHIFLAVALGALALRALLGPWGPLRINGIGPLWISSAASDPAATAAYGPGYVEIFGPLAALAPAAPDWAIFAGNAFLSAVAAALAFVVARLLGLERAAATTAGVLLAVDPIALRMAATESYFPASIFLCLAAAVLLLVGVKAHERGENRGWRAVAAMTAASLLLVQAARLHPSAWGAAASVPFIVFASPASLSRRRPLLFAASIFMLIGALVSTSGGACLEVLANMRSGTLMRPPPPALESLPWVALGLLLYTIFVPRRWLGIAAAIPLAGLLMTRHGYGQSWIWQQCYDRLYLTVPLIALLGALPKSLWARRWSLVTGAALLTVAWPFVGLPIVAARTTDHLEYRWLRPRLSRLPSECRVIHVASAGQRGMFLPTYVGARITPPVAIDPREPHTLAAALAPAACIYYVRTSLCSSAEGRPACAAIERRLDMTPEARTTFAARPSNDYLPYDADPVETVLARVVRVREP